MGKIFRSLDDPEFDRYFTEFKSFAFRLETRQHYDVSYERREFELFLDGQVRGEFPGIDQWIKTTVRPAVAAGKHLQRVHVVQEPLSDYVRFECGWAYTHTSAAGEDVQILPTPAGKWPDGLPYRDYWLFDGEILVEMHYRDNGVFEAGELLEDPEELMWANFWRELAMTESVPFSSFWRG